MDWPLQDNAHGKASKRACSLSPEENDCDISIYSLFSSFYKSYPCFRLRTKMLMRSIILLSNESIMEKSGIWELSR
jgi:hypothetical protein